MNITTYRSELLFIGTGAADWEKPIESGEFRGYSSLLIDNHILVDCSRTAPIRMREYGIDWDQVSDIIITHSHRDHFDQESILKLAEARRQSGKTKLCVHVEKSWASSVKSDSFIVNPVEVENKIQVGDYEILPLASNHMGIYDNEITLHYLFCKKNTCWLYATDGAWMLNRTWKILRKYKLDCWVVDCTIGDGHEGDYRIFEHNSLPMIRIMADTLLKQGVLKEDAAILLTHLARTLHPSQTILDEKLKPPYKVVYDGLVHRIP